MREITPKRIREMKGKEKITMITAYDYPSALLADKAGFDIVSLVTPLVWLFMENQVPLTSRWSR